GSCYGMTRRRGCRTESICHSHFRADDESGESWIQLASQPILTRRDLMKLARLLSVLRSQREHTVGDREESRRRELEGLIIGQMQRVAAHHVLPFFVADLCVHAHRTVVGENVVCSHSG